MEAGLSLGSNLGDRLAILREARDRVAAIRGVEILGQSRVYETEPVGVRPEYRALKYLNAVIVVDSDLAPDGLHEALHTIEGDLGRERSEDKYAPRTVDVDMVYAGGTVRDSAELQLPHPRWNERRFVVQPLVDVRPDLVLPGESRTVAEVLLSLPDSPGVVVYTAEW